MVYLISIVLLFGLMWLLLVRPQRRRQVQQLEMQDTLKLDDEVITAGGLHGFIKQLDHEVLTLEIAPDTRVRVDRRAIAGVVRNEPDAADEAEQLAQIPPDES
jgi:preprotein translocase subunit YajC